LEDARKATAEAAAETSRALNDLAKRAGSVVHERLDDLGVNPKDYVDYAGQRIGTAQEYLVEKINEQPVKATLAALGIGLALGFLLSR
jgi:ElaB/YqjD/DUF883 family membrane-anchored ribosome-binding protein